MIQIYTEIITARADGKLIICRKHHYDAIEAEAHVNILYRVFDLGQNDFGERVVSVLIVRYHERAQVQPGVYFL